MRFLSVITAALLGSTAAPAYANPVRWVDSVSISSNATALFIGKCQFLGCPEGKPITGSLSVGKTIHGMKIGAIRCEKQSKTIQGWRGGPKYVAIAGTWNCKASVDRYAVENTPGRNGERPYPWVSVVGARI